MTAKEIILLVLGGVLANNFVFERFLGLAPLFGAARKGEKLLALGLSVLAVMLVTAPLGWVVQTLVLQPLGLAFLQIPALAALVLAVTALLGLAADKLFKKPLGVYFPVIALNSAVLGLAIVASAADILTAVLTALGVGLGFLAALPVFSGVLSRIDEQAVPKAFRGLPIQLLAAGIVSLALLAFK